MNIKNWYLVVAFSLFFFYIPSACSSPPEESVDLASASTLNLILLDQDNYPDAVCVNGSPGAFIFRRGEGDGANKWVLVLQGGGGCNSRATCLLRNKRLISTAPWIKKSKLELSEFMDGIFNTNPENNPHFYNWNHVFFIYCSADTWGGRLRASPETEHINWVGHYVLEAIIKTLQDQSVIGLPTLTSAEEILFAGSSAGAGGVINNVDWLAELLISDQITARFKAVLDSGVGPLSAPDETFAVPGEFWGLKHAFYDEDCIAEHTEIGDPWICINTEYILANDYISTPLFVYHDQNDATLQSGYGAEIQTRILKIISSVPNGFSPNEGNHLLIIVPKFYSMTVEFPTEFIAGYENSLYLEAAVSYSFSDLLWLWYSQE